MLPFLSVLLEAAIKIQSLMHNIYESKPSQSCSSVYLASKTGTWLSYCVEGVPLYSLIC